MPQLKDCSEQQQYRVRCDSETEEILTCADANTSVSPSRIKLVSVQTKNTAKIRFHNLYERQVRALWMDFDGHEVTCPVLDGAQPSLQLTMEASNSHAFCTVKMGLTALQVAYSVLGPGESKLYLTYDKHCWIFRDLLSGRRLNIDKSQAVFAKKDSVPTVKVQAPPFLHWQEEHHLGFPEDFKAAIQTLLLCHNTLTKHFTNLSNNPSCNDNARYIKRCKICQLDTAKAYCCACLASGIQDKADRSHSSCRVGSDGQQSIRSSTHSQANLSCLPMHIVKEIICISAPTDVWQDACCTKGCPDIQPVVVPRELLSKLNLLPS